MAFVRHKASSDWRRLRVSLPFAPGELTASLASAVKEIRDQTSPDSAGALFGCHTWLHNILLHMSSVRRPDAVCWAILHCAVLSSLDWQQCSAHYA
jgi:hypothetical protein